MNYIESLILGFSLAAIPGPIFFEVVRRTLTKGFWSGALLSIGEFLANLIILLLIFFGIYNFLLYKSVKLTLYLFGSLTLIWIGITAIKIKKEDIKKSNKKKFSNNNSILVGFGLAIANPVAIAVWISIGGAYLAQYTSKLNIFINIIFLASGVMIFFFTLSSIIYFTRNKISTKYILLFSRIFGIILIIYGLLFLFKVISL